MHTEQDAGLRTQHTELVPIAVILLVQTFKTKQKQRNTLQEAPMSMEINSLMGNQK